jgi:hypothetical protein
MNPKIAPNITQPDGYGYQTRVWSRGKEFSRFFSFLQWGSKVKALKAAKSWRDQLQTVLKKGSRRLTELPKDNTSGVLGVRLDESYSRRKDRIIIQYSVCWTDHKGKLKNKSFYIGNEFTWTQRKQDLAFKVACLFRKEWEEYSDNNKLDRFDPKSFNGWQN